MKPCVMVSNRRALQIPSTLYRSPYKSPLIVRYATCLNRRVILKRDYGLNKVKVKRLVTAYIGNLYPHSNHKSSGRGLLIAFSAEVYFHKEQDA